MVFCLKNTLTATSDTELQIVLLRTTDSKFYYEIPQFKVLPTQINTSQILKWICLILF